MVQYVFIFYHITKTAHKTNLKKIFNNLVKKKMIYTQYYTT